MLYVNKTEHYKYKFKISLRTSKLLYFLVKMDKKPFIHILQCMACIVLQVEVIFVGVCLVYVCKYNVINNL